MKRDRKKKIDPLKSDSVPVAIIGIGCMFPQADNAGEFWTNIKDGVDSITEVPETHWRSEDYYHQDPKAEDKVYAKLGGFLSPVEFNPMDYGILPNTIEAIDTAQLLGLLAVEQALKDAGYSRQTRFDRDRVSVILGVTGTLELVIPLGARLGYPKWQEALQDAGVDQDLAEDILKRISESYVPWQENSFPGLLGNVVAGRISKQFDFGGTNCVVDAACGSSLSALNMAALELAAGRSDMVVTGGIDTFNDIFMYTCFSKTLALSPSGHARPFDADSDGTALGEGLGILVLKRLTDAEQDGDKIYAVIKGIGTSSDGHGAAIYEPEAKGQEKALSRAYRQGQVLPNTIELIEGHGTGTKVGDTIEVSALQTVFGPTPTPWCALGSVKSQIGHTKAAAGSAGLIKAALALYHKTLPATIKVRNPMEHLRSSSTPFYLNTESRPWLPRGNHPRRAGISALGFGGSNFHCLLEEHQPDKLAVDWKGDIQVIPFSATNDSELAEQLQSFPTTGSWSQLRLEAKSRRDQYDPADSCRLILVIEKNRTQGISQLKTALAMLKKESSLNYWESPDGVYYSSEALDGKTALLFPGQGAQYPGMLKDLAIQFPEFLAGLQEAGDAFAENTKTSREILTDLIYPRPQFNQAEKADAESLLRQTEVAQPALGAVSMAASQVLSRFGISVDMVAGHSYGELPALCIADVFTTNDLHYLSRIRGELMAAGKDDCGTMLAVSAPLKQIEDILQEEALNLVLANRNTPTQGVLSGATTEIEKAAQLFDRKGINCKQLTVSAAFHSDFIADAALPFTEKLKTVSFESPQKIVFSNLTGSRYPASVDDIKKLLAEQLINPVDFVSEVEAMYQAGARVFIEVGPGARLTGMVKSILGEKDYHSVALDSSNGKRSGIIDLARLLAQLSVLGKSVDWSLWDEGCAPSLEQPENKTPKMTVSLCGANYYKRPEKRPPVKSKPVVSEHQLNQPSEMSKKISHKSQQQVTDSPVPSGNHQEALRITQQSMQALKDLQEQTSSLHQKFLEGQQAAIGSLMKLADQQHQLLRGEIKTEIPDIQASMTNPQAKMPDVAIQPSETISPEPVLQDAGNSNQTGIASLVIEIIAEKTGYPVEMLELDMALDADLGIDSIKRVEILSAVQEKLPNAPVIAPEELATLQTLGQIVDHLKDGMPHDKETGNTSSPKGNIKKEITTIMLEIVAEKTGYPTEMLELDMALDTDLGIDSIKRVEILSALQEKLSDAPAIPPEDLASLQSLGQIVDYLCEGAVLPSHTVEAGNSGGTDKDDISRILLEVIAEKTGYPVEMLELDMSLDNDLGIDSIKRVEILSALQERLPGAPVIKPDHLGTLQTVEQIIDFLSSVSGTNKTKPSQTPVQETTPRGITRQVLQTKSLPKNRPVRGLSFPPGSEIWIADDGSTLSDRLCEQFSIHQLNPSKISIENNSSFVVPKKLTGLIIPAPQNGTDDLFLSNSFKLLQQVGPALQNAAQAGEALFATVSRMDGHFGLDSDAKINDTLSGGLAGLSKTAALEWPEIHCKALDLAIGIGDSAAETITEEVLKKGPIEVGITPQGLLELELTSKRLEDSDIAMPVQEGDLVVISGGARGVTGEVAVALSGASKATLLLLGRSRMPDEEPEWLNNLTTEAEIKKALVDHANTPLKPLDVAREYDKISAEREIRTTLDKILKGGGKALYRSVDIRDRGAVQDIIDEIQEQYGPVKGLIHGAGILADKLIAEKTVEQFDQVYSTKVEGLRTLLDTCNSDHLKFMVMFSSSTGRFGRIGQVDYAVANEVLNKIAGQQAESHHKCRVLSINWGPWNGGMVTPALKKVFQQEGIDVIDLQAGADYLLKEISTKPGGPVELVISGGKLGYVEKEQLEPPGNIHVSKVFDLNISIERYPFLKSHILDGKAVLPMAVIIEWLAHGAMHNNPGLKFQGFNDLRILKGVIIEPEDVYNVQVMAGKAIKSDGLYVVPVELSGFNNQGKYVAHARSRIELSYDYAAGKPVTAKLTLPEYPHGIDDIYQPGRLFHGKDFHGIREMTGCSTEGISARVNVAPSPDQWIEEPLRNSWFADPLVLDSSFQLLTLWSIERYQAGSLPVFAGRYRQYQEKFPKTGIEIRAQITEQNSNRAFANMDFIDTASGVLIARLERYECVIDASLKVPFQRNKLSGVA